MISSLKMSAYTNIEAVTRAQITYIISVLKVVMWTISLMIGYSEQ